MPRKSIIVAILVVIVLLVADVAAASVENRRAADAFARTQDLKVTPYVHINGFPFVLQGILGHYRFVTVQADPAHTTGDATITIHPLRLSIFGVRTHDGFSGATAQRATGTARVGYRSLSAGLGKRVRFAGAGRVTATVTLRVDGRTFRPSVSAKPEISGTGLVFHDVTVTDQRGLPASSATGLEKIFAKRVELGTFPFGLRPTRLYLSATGLLFKVSGRDVKLGSA